MRPLQLELNYFGPYRQQKIDFTKFDQQSMFLISGPTGAGKSTIFDGLVFALYGSGSGPQRRPQDFRSEFATPADETSVKVSFTQQGQLYELIRKPAQTLAKKRGNGTTDVTSSAELTIYQDVTDQTEVKQLTRVNQVNLYLADLLQMNADQFRQIVLLPQGEFRQFLDGDSDQKEAVLRNLFQTQRYERWVDQIQQLYKTASAKNKAHQDQLDFLLAQIPWQPAYQPAATAPLAQRQSLLKQQLTALMRAQEQAQQSYQQKEAAVNQQQQLVNQQQQVLSDFQQREQVLKEQQTLLAQQPKIQQLINQRDLYQWAQQQAPSWEQYQQQIAQQQQWQVRLQTKQQEQEQTQRQIKLTQAQVNGLLAQAPAYEQQQQQLTHWQALQPLYETVAHLTTKAKRRQAQVDQGQAALAQQQVTLADNQQRLTELKQQTERQTPLLTRQAALQQQSQQLKHWQHTAKALAQVAAQLAQQAQTLQQLKAKQVVENQAQVTATQNYQQLKSDFAKNQIALLSQDLLPGTPCPVCGSMDHPQLATTVITADPVTQAEVEAADKKRQQAATQLANTVASITSLQKQVDLTTTENQAALQQLINEVQMAAWLTTRTDCQSNIELAQLMALLQAEQQANHEQLQELAQEQQNLAQASVSFKRLTLQQEQLLTQQQQATAQQQQLANELLVTQTQLHDQQQQLPTEFPTLTALTASLQQGQQAIQHYQAETKSQQQGLQQLQQTLAEQNTDQKHYQEQLRQVTATLQQQQAKLAAVWQRQWPTLTFAEQQAKLDELISVSVDLDILQQQITDYEHNKIRLETLVNELAAKLVGVETAPDLTTVQAELQALKEQASVQQRQVTEIENQQQQLQKIADQLVEISQQMTDLTSLQELSEVTRGLGSQKLGLERYVLQMYLNEVLKVANSRLSQLTAGRYQLALADELGTNRKNSGLELNVYDDYTGDYRSVRTLSGGESFIAALALALALGEVVQQQTGAIEINALFVDEGFGSLDETSLQTAIAALTSLEGQQRLIGIISHVRELQVQLPNQLQVVPDGNGESHVQYQVLAE